jgi:hypothetical protein
VIKQSKHRKAGNCHAQNVGQIASLKTSEEGALRVFQQLNDQIMNCLNKPDGDLGSPILNANAIAVMAYPPVKGGMN